MIAGLGNAFTRLAPSWQGAAWMTMSALLFAGQAAIVRYLSKEMHFLEISLFRALFGVVAMLPWLMRTGIGVMRTRHAGLYAGRGLLSTIAMYGWFGSLALIPIADATAISFTFPLFIALFGVIFLRESAHPMRWAALFIGFAGTLVIVRPGFQEVNIGMVMVIGAGLCIATSAMMLKVAIRSDHPDTAVLYQSVFMLPFAVAGAALVWQWPSAEQWLWGLALGAASATAQRFYTRAFAVGETGAVAPFDFARLPFAVALGFVAFAELPDLWTVLGAAIIFAAWIVAERSEARRSRG
ncbi:MAG: DMT family transporter [Defluviicoccus sp.]|nr:DMT family transporter [Defluviicoccus sp.]MDE0383452.1 DMT family transporter [Defluviicoccus sp.]